MTDAAAPAPRAALDGGGARRPPAALLLPVLVPFALALLVAALRGIPSPEWLVAALGNDSAMRLVSVRELIAGQGWLDALQPRLGPEGTLMHWSRLVDAPIAAIVLAAEPLAGRAMAEHAALVTWPLAMLAACTAAAYGIGRASGGTVAGLYAGGCAFAALVVGSRFLPGDIDHHNVQAALLLCAIWGAARGGRGPAAAGGLAIAASLAVGVETLPMLAAIGAAVALAWAALGAPWRETALWLSAGLAGGLAILFPLTAPAAAWRGGFCDAISLDLAAPVAGGALLLAALAALASHRGPAARAGLLALGGGAIGAATLALAPACLSNPYDALDPWLVARWLDLVEEAKGLRDVLAGEVSGIVSLSFVVGAAALALAALAALRLRSAPFGLVALALAVAWIMSAYQVRASLYVTALSAIAFGMLAARLRARGGIAALGALACLAAPLPMLWQVGLDLARAPAAPAPAAAPRAPCLAPGMWDALGAAPAGLVAGTTDLGAGILRDTHHAVLAAPYHRNQAGMIAQLRITLAEDADAARARLAEAGAAHVALCVDAPELRALAARGHVGFYHALAAGDVPDWLEPLPAAEGSGLRVWAVR